MNEELKLRQRELALESERLRCEQELPHLYGFKFYSWARQFFETRNHVALISAGNQISKSSTQIRKVIHWATDQNLWKDLWPRRPLQFWYLYPTYQIATQEFKKKWVPEFLPRGKMKDSHPLFGWKEEWRHGVIVAIHFKSDVSIYFKTYAMDTSDLQAGSVDYCAFDEELPEMHLAELQMRLIATAGYFSGVFTPTLGQEVWRRAFEEVGKSKETFKGALKLQVSMYDCMKYEDGSASHWTNEVIERAKSACKSEAQIQQRVYGRCVPDEGLKYPAFSRKENIVELNPKGISPEWDIFVGVDIGSGGDAHPSAVIFTAVNPERTNAFVFKGWRGDGIVTTASDVVHQVILMSAGLKVTRIFYDYSAPDFYQIANGMNLPVETAEKKHDLGEQVLNVLFKNKMLSLWDIPELDPLCVELTTLKLETQKRFAHDDFCDALRYSVSKVEFDWSILNIQKPKTSERKRTQIDERREFISWEEQRTGSYEEEIGEWNDLMEVDNEFFG